MFRKFVNWCIGFRRYKVRNVFSKDISRLLTISNAESVLKNENDYIFFSFPTSEGKYFEKLLLSNSIEYEMTEHGLMYLLKKYKKRPGILIGMILFVIMLETSRSFVWNIEVVNNNDIPSNEIISELKSLGFGIGTYIPSVDFDKLHTDLLQSDRRLAWVAVNMFGTHANVEVREALLASPAPDEDTPYNLIAAEDGIIESIDIYRGTKQVTVGEPIKAGQLLASGIVETPNGFNLVHARGVVKANVGRSIRIEIPLKRDKKIYTGKEYREITLKFLGFSFKVFKSTGNSPTNCDIIESERKLCFFGIFEVPIILHEKISREYEFSNETITPEAAKVEAFEKLQAECALADGELASREINAGLNGDTYIISCKLRIIKNIAVESKIYR